jgi:predicted phage terminase large subunit-like protein
MNMGKKHNRAELLTAFLYRKAEWDFKTFRKVINPKLIEGWFQDELADILQQFYADFLAGKRPKLIIEAPPQHGKSHIIVDFIAWVSGKNPDLKTIFASYADRLGIRSNLRLQKIYDSYEFHSVFPDLEINQVGAVNQTGQTLRNKEILEYRNAEGSFRNTTVMGGITGEGLDLGIIDDATKGRAEARSKAIKLKTLDWFKDDFFTRFSNFAGFINIQTRWCIDDVAGFMREKFKGVVKVVSYPAIAVKDEEHRKKGEALFPEFKDLDFLMERKLLFDSSSWSSLYQQNPTVDGGELLNENWFPRYNQSLPPQFEFRLAFGDTAQKTEERHDYSVFSEWGFANNRIYLLDLIRGKWDAPDLEQKLIDFWNKCKGRDEAHFGAIREVFIEDKASGTGLIQGIMKRGGIPIEGIGRSVDKYSRMLDVIPYIKSGYVLVPENAIFVLDFLQEAKAFTADNTHPYDDQLDTMIDAINKMLVGSSASEILAKMMAS